MPAAIVTGGDSGLGRASAVILAERGWDVGVTFRSDEDGAREAVAEIEGHGRRGEARRLDATQTATIAGVVGELADAPGGLICFIANTGANA
ncbi:MAG: SDR family NAD(P)-dependent oxidoreductase, partial [Solirubrobacteraceae bacterium]